MPHPNDVRGPIELTHNVDRDDIEKQYIADRNELEDEYHADIKANLQAKQTALVGAGFNPDGSVPPDFYDSP